MCNIKVEGKPTRSFADQYASSWIRLWPETDPLFYDASNTTQMRIQRILVYINEN